MNNLVTREVEFLVPIVEEYKIVSRTVHFGKSQNHGAKVAWGRAGVECGVKWQRGAVPASRAGRDSGCSRENFSVNEGPQSYAANLLPSQALASSPFWYVCGP